MTAENHTNPSQNFRILPPAPPNGLAHLPLRFWHNSLADQVPGLLAALALRCEAAVSLQPLLGGFEWKFTLSDSCYQVV
jgi:hypothetical protein